MSIQNNKNSRFPSSSVLKGSLDATLAANLPAVRQVGDVYDISVAGSFENEALILPAGAYFSVPDQIRWNGTNFTKMEAGDNISDAVFDPSWEGNVNNAPSKNAVYDEVIKKVNILDSTTAGFGFVIDEDTLASNLDTKVPTQQSVKAYADAKVNDTAFEVGWDADTAIAPTKNAVYDEVIKKVNILDSTTAGFGFVIDEDTLASNLDTKVPTQQSVKAYADAKVNDTAFEVGWDADTAIAPSKNAVYDVLNPLKTKSEQQDATKTVSTQTYTFLDTDHGKTIFFDYAGAVTITCPQSLTSTVHVTCVAEGATTTLAFVAGGTATYASKDSKTTVTARYGVATLVHKGSNAWFGFGNLE